MTPYRPLVSLVASLGIACAVQTSPAPSREPPPPPCAGNDTVYVRADAARGLTAAQPTGIVLPPPELHGTLDVATIMDARGRVEPDGITLTPVGETSLSPRVAAATRERVSAFSFWPAVLRDCAVRFRYQVRISKE